MRAEQTERGVGRPPTPQGVDLSALLRSPENRSPVENKRVADVEMGIKILDSDRAFSLAKKILGGIGQDTDKWNVDTRQVAGALWSFMLFDNLNPRQLSVLKNTLLVQIEKQCDLPDPHPLGSIESLLDAGIHLAPYFPDDSGVDGVLGQVEEKFKTDSAWKGHLAPKVEQIRDPFPDLLSRVLELSGPEVTITDLAEKLDIPPQRVWRVIDTARLNGQEIAIRISAAQTNEGIEALNWRVLDLWHNRGGRAGDIARGLGVFPVDVERRVNALRRDGLIAPGNVDLTPLQRNVFKLSGAEVTVHDIADKLRKTTDFVSSVLNGLRNKGYDVQVGPEDTIGHSISGLTKLQQGVLDASNGGTLTISEIGLALGKPRAQVSDIISLLRKRGHEVLVKEGTDIKEEVLERCISMPPREIAAALGVSLTTVYVYIEKLIEQGLVAREDVLVRKSNRLASKKRPKSGS